MDNRPAGLLGLFGGAEPSMRFAGLLGQPEAQALPEINVTSAQLPGTDAHNFIQQQLNNGEPQMQQYDPQSGAAKALEYGRLLPGTGAVKAFGFYPDGRGGYLPSMREDLDKGRPLDAAIDALGLAIPAYRGFTSYRRFFDIGQPPKK